MAQMKGCVPLVLCVAIFSTPSLAETKQSQPPSSIQPGTTIQTLNKMCQENANSRPYTACVAYLRGLFDGMQQAKIVEDLKNTFCPPVTAETDQLRLSAPDSRAVQSPAFTGLFIFQLAASPRGPISLR
jgi:hypothetical protein